MKAPMKQALIAITVGMMVLVFGVMPSMSFHSGDKLICRLCHTMHNSEDGADVVTGGPFPDLLLRENRTDLCLTCHADGTTITYSDSSTETTPDVWDAAIETPGGDFVKADGTGNTGKGHNPYFDGTGNESTIVDKDPTLDLTPPGGASALSKWTCLSCHDAHGTTSDTSPTVYKYRNLLKRVKGPGGTEIDVSTAIGSGDTDEATLGTAEGDTNKNIYKNGSSKFSAWCAACHTDFHATTNRHPTDENLGSELAGNYGDAYSYQYPVIAVGETWTPGTASAGVDGDEEVFCLTCHKAHATDYSNITRWDNNEEQGANAGCNKCHKKGS